MSQTSEMTRPKAGEVSWNQLIAANAGPAGDFYAQLFGWQPAPFVPQGMPSGTAPFTLFKTDPDMLGGVAGMVQSQRPEAPSQWIPYVVVNDLEAALAQAVKLGATVRLAEKSIGEIGRIAVITDPQGAPIGLHEFPK
jgi:predicted enzyme related to lactoylglutathione lyase